jgi:hypothetical protein
MDSTTIASVPMNTQLTRVPRAIGATLLIAGPILAVGYRGQMYIPFVEVLGDRLILASRIACLLSGVLMAFAGFRIVRAPELWGEFPFLRRTRFWCYLIAGLLGLFLGLGLSLAGNDAANIPCRSFCALWLGLCVSWFSWPAWARRWARSLASLQLWRFFEVAAANIVAAILLSELTLRCASAIGWQNYLLLNHAAGYRVRQGRHSNGLKANSLGFVGDEFKLTKSPGKIRIAALGDSFSVGIRVPYEDNYLTIVEQRLMNAELYNFGVCCTGPREYRILLSTLVWSYHPDLVILPIYLGNDITEVLPAAKLRKFSPDALHIVWFGLRAVRLVAERFRLAAEGNADAFKMVPLSEFSEDAYLRCSATRLDVCHVPDPPRLFGCWKDAYHELDGIVVDCREHKVPLLVLLLPDEFQVNSGLLRRDLEVRGWQRNEVDLALPNRRLSEFFRRRNVPCLDLLASFVQAGGQAYYRNDCHWNVLGNHLAAEAIGPWLREQLTALCGTIE